MAKICQSSNFVTLQRALQLRAIRLESIAIRLELESIASRLEAIAVIWLEQKTEGLTYQLHPVTPLLLHVCHGPQAPEEPGLATHAAQGIGHHTAQLGGHGAGDAQTAVTRPPPLQHRSAKGWGDGSMVEGGRSTGHVVDQAGGQSRAKLGKV